MQAKQTTKPWADAHKAWAIFLVALVIGQISLRFNFWLNLATGMLGIVGAFYGCRGLVKGPMRFLGGLFLLLNALAVAGAVAEIIHVHFGK